MRRKHECPECHQVFDRFGNMKRHLITIHPEEFGHWDLKTDVATEHQSRSEFPFRQSHDNHAREQPLNIEEFLIKKMRDLVMTDLQATVFDPDLGWKTNLLNEIQMIKIEIQTIKNILLTNQRY
jgi:hypothetical protein